MSGCRNYWKKINHDESLSFQLIRILPFTSVDSEYEQLPKIEMLWTGGIRFPNHKMHHMSRLYQVEYVWWWHTGENRCHYAVIIQHAAAERQWQLYRSAHVRRDHCWKQTVGLWLRGVELRGRRKHRQQKKSLNQPWSWCHQLESSASEQNTRCNRRLLVKGHWRSPINPW